MRKVTALLLAALLAVSLCACGAPKTSSEFALDAVPMKVVAKTKGQRGQTFKFKGASEGKTVVYTMTREGKDADVNHIPDKIFAPMLTDRKKGAVNEAILTLLNYQYTNPEWSAYYFHNTLFAFSDAVLEGKTDTFKIKRKKEDPFFAGTVKLGENRMPEVVRTTIFVPATKSHKAGKDYTEYHFHYNDYGNIDRVTFAEHADWSDLASAQIDISYLSDGKTIEKISKVETNSAYDSNYFTFRPVYEDGEIAEVDITRDTTGAAILDEDNPSSDIMAIERAWENRYTGFDGHRYQAKKDNAGKSIMNADGKAEYKWTDAKTAYEYEGDVVTRLTVTDTGTKDIRTYEYWNA